MPLGGLNPDQTGHEKNRANARFFSWLGIKNDYQTLIGIDGLEIVETAEDDEDEEENSNV